MARPPTRAKGPAPRDAAYLIGAFWAIAVVVFGVLERLIDPQTFHSVWLGIWWAVQTVTIQIATLVLPLTEDGRITDYEQRKAALREQVASAGHEALMVFAADKISKARELRLARERARQSRLQPAIGRTESDQKLADYRRCHDLLEQRLTDSRLVTQLRTELDKAPDMPNRSCR